MVFAGTETARSPRGHRGTTSVCRTGCPVGEESPTPRAESLASLFDFEAAWRGGSSLLVSGALTAPVTVELYATRITAPEATVQLVHRSDPGSPALRIDLAVALAEPDRPGAPTRYLFVPAGTLRAGGSGWTTVNLPLKRLLPALRGKTIHRLAVRLTAATRKETNWRLGALTVRNSPSQPAPPAKPTAVKIDTASVTSEGSALIRVRWNRSTSKVHHYEVHEVLPDKSLRFVGGTSEPAYFMEIRRNGKAKTSRFQVTAINELYASSAPVPLTYTWRN